MSLFFLALNRCAATISEPHCGIPLLISMNNKELLEIIKQAAKRQATVLHLFNEGLTALPPELFKLSQLEELGLSNCP